MDEIFTLSNSQKVLQDVFKKYFSECNFEDFLINTGQPLIFTSFYHRMFTANIHHVEIEKNYLGDNVMPGSIKRLIQIRLINTLKSAKDIIEEDIKHLKEIE